MKKKASDQGKSLDLIVLQPVYDIPGNEDELTQVFQNLLENALKYSTDKQKVDRLCMLSLGRTSEAATLLEDHRKLAQALKQGSIAKSIGIVRQHMSRLDDTIAEIRRDHSEYFE